MHTFGYQGQWAHVYWQSALTKSASPACKREYNLVEHFWRGQSSLDDSSTASLSGIVVRPLQYCHVYFTHRNCSTIGSAFMLVKLVRKIFPRSRWHHMCTCTCAERVLSQTVLCMLSPSLTETSLPGAWWKLASGQDKRQSGLNSFRNPINTGSGTHRPQAIVIVNTSRVLTSLATLTAPRSLDPFANA